jgi:hypothetical protein
VWRPYLDRKAREHNPALWDAAAHKPQTGKKRANYRKAARAALAMREFTLQKPEARCANCLHFGRHPEDRSKRICELGSDFQGYQLADAKHVCISHNGGFDDEDA